MRTRYAGVWVGLCATVAGCLNQPPPRLEPSTPPAQIASAAQELLWEGVSVAKAYPVGDVRAFELRQGGRRIGGSWGRYLGPVEGEAGHHRFQTRIELIAPGRGVLRSEGELVLDEAGFLVRGFERSPAAELHFERKQNLVTITDGRTVDEVAYDPAAGQVAVMAHSAILHEELMLRLRSLRAGSFEMRLLSLSGGPPTRWQGEVEARGEQVVVRTNLGEEITLSDGLISEVRVEATGLEIIALKDASWPPWVLKRPVRLSYTEPPDAKFTRRELELPGKPGEPVLFGEVLLPTQGRAPFPAVLWISSSGREDRFGFAGPPPVDLGSHRITDALANAGFVVLRFDERGRGRSAQGEVSFLGQVEDAKRAFRMLMVQPEVEPDRVIVVGHGEGGLRALHVAATARGLAGLALLAVPGRPYREVFAAQARVGLRDVPADARRSARQEQRRMLAAIDAGGELPPELEAQGKWIREMFAQRVDKLVAAVDAPIWIAQGDKDFEVDSRADVAALVRAAKGHNKSYTVARFKGLDHLFVVEPGVSSPQRYLEPNRVVDPGFVAALATWAHATAQAAQPTKQVDKPS